MQSLKSLNSFQFEVFAENITRIQDEVDLLDFVYKPDSTLFLGDGSNIAFTEDFKGEIVRFEKDVVSIEDLSDSVRVTAFAGKNWHDFVLMLNSKGINGLENLALIPGTIGAAPIQNIGAYGVEISQYINQVNYFDFGSKQFKSLSNQDCHFGYRDSIFKTSEFKHCLIVSVEFNMPKQWQPVLKYSGLEDLGSNCSAYDVLQRVISIRRSKLPDPKEIGNAGSFFKNPILTGQQYRVLKKQYETMPCYHLKDGSVKVPAAWLIDQAGFRGKEVNGICAYINQPLVLTNTGTGTGEALLAYAREVQKRVENMFNIKLHNEVNLLAGKGKVSL